MPANVKPIFTNKDTVTYVQIGGPGHPFQILPCTAITNWSRDYEETVYVKCKSPSAYGRKEIVATIPGSPNEPTFDAVAYTSRETDLLLNLTCPVDFQVRFGSCSTPSDPLGYTKIRHFYKALLTSVGEDNVDFIGDENYEGIQHKASFTCKDIVTILKPTVQSVSVTEAQGMNDVALLTETRCDGECGAGITAGQWGVAVANANYGSMTANVWVTRDGQTWTLCTTDPFSDSNAHVSSCVILAGSTAPRIIVARGNVSSTYGVRFAVSDDWGETWSEVNGGGTTGVHYINSMFRYNDGLIWAVGNGGKVYYSTDRGTSWTTVSDTGTTNDLWDIHTFDGQVIYAVGNANTVIVSTDGGETWSTVTGPASSDAYALYTVQAVGRYRILIGGQIDENGKLLWSTDDGGETWTALTFTGSTTSNGAVRRLRVAKPAVEQHLILLHGTESAPGRYGAGTNFRFFRTIDGGASWERLNLLSNNGLNGLAVVDINTAIAVGEPVSGYASVQKLSI